ncbi:hypothetical protein TPMD03_2 [Thiohalocapsa phage LS06-2018-MD03]|nr:hypothetical protein TPMD03_2 [Thiohalocapsa phage LS06-2018-MD03]
MIDFRLNFGGFYYSIHEELINCIIDDYFPTNEERESYEDLIKWDVIYKQYCINYVEDLEEYIEDKLGLKIDIKFEDLISPKFYNYSTDYIAASLSSIDSYALITYYKHDEDFIKYVNETSRSYDGFISFYQGFTEVCKHNDIFLAYIFNFIILKFEEEYMSYYDRNNRYEILNGLDFIEGD